jgi:hypothetical protein
LTAMKLHLAMRKKFPKAPTLPYSGIAMVDEVLVPARARTALLEKRMGWYQAYVDRGGVLNEQDMRNLDLSAENN